MKELPVESLHYHIPEGIFLPSTECLGLIKISPQTLAGSWMRLVVQKKYRFINTLPRICRAECTQRHERAGGLRREAVVIIKMLIRPWCL